MSGTTVKYRIDNGEWVTLDAPDIIKYGIWDAECIKPNDIDISKDNGKERKNMEILNLYKDRCEREIFDRYTNIIDEEYEALDVVKEYNELINTFNINMKQLADKYNTNDITYLYKSGYENDYKYELNDDIKSHIREKYKDAWDKELSDLRKFVEEVKAVLSLSEDKDYQLDVLKNYEILDKKGKLNV